MCDGYLCGYSHTFVARSGVSFLMTVVGTLREFQQKNMDFDSNYVKTGRQIGSPEDSLSRVVSLLLTNSSALDG